MAKLNDVDIEEIVRRDLPGYRVVARSGVSSGELDSTAPFMKREEAVSPTLAELRRKYLAGRAPLTPSGVTNGMAGTLLDEEIVTVENESALDSTDQQGRKRVIISATERKVLGMQG